MEEKSRNVALLFYSVWFFYLRELRLVAVPRMSG